MQLICGLVGILEDHRIGSVEARDCGVRATTKRFKAFVSSINFVYFSICSLDCNSVFCRSLNEQTTLPLRLVYVVLVNHFLVVLIVPCILFRERIPRL